MPMELFQLAEREGIIIEWWDFEPPLEAVYWAVPGLPPVIGLANSLDYAPRAYFRCVLAEELGHHFTTVGCRIPRTYFHYRDRMEVSRAEYRALRWAAQWLIPLGKLAQAFKWGSREENSLDLSIERRTKLPAWLLGHVWYGDSPGARLRQARVAKSMTIRDLADATGLTTATISSLEAGRTTASLPNLRKLAQVLGVPIAYLGCFETLPENTLGQRITKARLFHGLTKEEFAQIIGVDVKTLRHWEQGKHVPLPRYFNVLNQYLKVLEE